jgi:hypothetical protein
MHRRRITRVRAISSNGGEAKSRGSSPRACNRKNQIQVVAPGIGSFGVNAPLLIDAGRCLSMAGCSFIEKLASAKCRALPQLSEKKPNRCLAECERRLAIIDAWIAFSRHRSSIFLSSAASSSSILRWWPPQARKLSPGYQRADDTACRHRREPIEGTANHRANGRSLDDLVGAAEVANGG